MSDLGSIDGLHNVRDLGGHRTRDGRTVRSGEVVRSDNLIGLTDQGEAELMRLVAPRTVVDLRMVSETDALGYELNDAAVSVLKRPMTPQSGATPEQLAAGGADNLVDDYLRQVEVNADSIIATLQLIADPANRPVVIHCTAGKDRTGIVVAILLSILGVEDEDIVADYHVTTANMAPIVDRIRAASVYRDNGLAAALQWIFDSEPETMRAFLVELEVRYGTAEDWALAKGLPPETITALRDELLA